MLWVQAPIFVALLLLASRAWLRGSRHSSSGRLVLLGRWAGALLVPLLLTFVLPLSDYHFSGHEGAYGELLAGVLPERADLTSHRTFALPAGLAWAMGKLLPQQMGETLWLLGNRAALGLVLLLLADCSGLLHRRFVALGERKSSGSGSAVAGILALIVGGLTPSLLGWSATGFAVVPALALGLLSLRLGLAGRPGFLLAFGACAVATRMETAPLVLAALLLCPRAAWRRGLTRAGLAGLCAGLGLLGFQVLTLVLKTARLPVEEGSGGLAVVLENVANLPLGGAALEPLAGGLAVALVVASGLLVVRRGQTPLVLAVAVAVVVVALAQPLLLVDLGARHLLPAGLLVALLVTPLAADALLGRGLLRKGLAVAWLLSLLLPSVVGLRDLDRRYMSGFDAVPVAWDRLLSAAPRGAASELLENTCYVVMPGGREFREGAGDTMDVREVHRAASELRAGRCVQWLVENDFEFSGDTRSERLDRAVRTLGLVPVAWLTPPPRGEQAWVVLRAESKNGYASDRSSARGKP